jgi:hypothetical protein
MNDELNGRTVWRGQADVHSADAWADAIAGSDAQLFDEDGSAIWLDEGAKRHVGGEALRQIIKRFIAFPRPMNFGTVEEPNWGTAYTSIEPDDMVLRALLGTLPPRLPKAPGKPRELSPQQQREAIMRMKTGERPARIAEAYGVEVARLR